MKKLIDRVKDCLNVRGIIFHLAKECVEDSGHVWWGGRM